MAKKRYSSKMSFKDGLLHSIKKPIKKKINKIGSKHSGVKQTYAKFRVWNRRRRQKKFYKLPVDEKLVLFESFMGRKYADSPKAIYEYMKEDPAYADYKFIWCFKDRVMETYLDMEKDGRTKLVLWGSQEYYKYFATSKYWFTNSRVLLTIEPREEQVFVQCWHGTPLKRIGFDIENEAKDARNSPEVVRNFYESDAKKYTYMVSPSGFCSEKFTSAFNLKAIGKDDIMLEVGYPRNDEIARADEAYKKRIREELGIPEDKKVILYAPTWRENNHKVGKGYLFESPFDMDKLYENLKDDYVIIFRLHYFVADQMNFDKYGDFIINASKYPEINDLYVAADALITDYSSVFFDFGILKRPIMFYMYDLDYYKDELRGFYLSLDELPGPIIQTQDELEHMIKTMDQWTNTEEYAKKYEEFSNRFTYLDDGHASERVVKAVIG